MFSQNYSGHLVPRENQPDQPPVNILSQSLIVSSIPKGNTSTMLGCWGDGECRQMLRGGCRWISWVVVQEEAPGMWCRWMPGRGRGTRGAGSCLREWCRCHCISSICWHPYTFSIQGFINDALRALMKLDIPSFLPESGCCLVSIAMSRCFTGIYAWKEGRQVLGNTGHLQNRFFSSL